MPRIKTTLPHECHYTKSDLLEFSKKKFLGENHEVRRKSNETAIHLHTEKLFGIDSARLRHSRVDNFR